MPRRTRRLAARCRALAFAARQQEYDKARTQLLERLAKSPEQAELETARVALNRASRPEEGQGDGDAAALAGRFEAAVAARKALEAQLRQRLATDFADIAQVWHISKWEPPAGYLERFLEAAQQPRSRHARPQVDANR